ncbi:MAG: hypothetical protein QXO75_04750 [Nitrososphaerota archaeon]
MVDRNTLEKRKKAGMCRFCGKSITKFRDEASEREYRLTDYVRSARTRCLDRDRKPITAFLRTSDFDFKMQLNKYNERETS